MFIIRVHCYSQQYFIPIKGENFDGNTFSEIALNSGAYHVIVDNPKFYKEELSMTLVNDSVEFLQELANYHRRQFSIPVIGITGSNGKTIVKEWLLQFLQNDHQVVASPKSYNSQIGVPLSVYQLKDGGIMVIPVGSQEETQHIIRITREGDKFDVKTLLPVKFVPLLSGIVHSS
mgnify:CR=1 FL=1